MGLWLVPSGDGLCPAYCQRRSLPVICGIHLTPVSPPLKYIEDVGTNACSGTSATADAEDCVPPMACDSPLVNEAAARRTAAGTGG
eukprot:1159001-Pelagomonas_calceolata.AAC.13